MSVREISRYASASVTCARFPECAVRSRADEFGQRCAIVEHDDRNPAAYGNLRGIAVDELVAQSVDLQIAQRRMVESVFETALGHVAHGVGMREHRHVLGVGDLVRGKVQCGVRDRRDDAAVAVQIGDAAVRGDDGGLLNVGDRVFTRPPRPP